MTQPLKDQYPEIHAFVRGYLHEDVVEEYGSPAQAAKNYRAGAGQHRLQQMKSEWARFLAINTDVKTANAALQHLGSAWQFSSMDEIRGMASEF